MPREDFTEHVVSRGLATRDLYQARRLNEETPDDRRLAFARRLYQHGSIAG